MDQRKIKLMTMYKDLQTRGSMDRLYVSRKEGGRVLSSIDNSVEASIQVLVEYIEKSKE